jgi:SagB-type dehydrogenase family enzyme
VSGFEDAIAYHERSKHHLHRYARALGYLDWDTQPDPFRRYAGATLQRLPLVTAPERPAQAVERYDAIYVPSLRPPRPFDRAALAQLFQDSLGLSAWKEHQGHRWALRMNPSSGNLHPTEGWLVDASGVYHYAPREHALELRVELDASRWSALAAALPQPCVLVALTSIVWRESWKYGERAYRYCQHDAGHALAGIALAASLLGWDARPLPDVTDARIAALLGIADQDDDEREEPDLLLVLVPAGTAVDPAATVQPPALRFAGTRNVLSREHHDWPVLEEIARACERTQRFAASLPAGRQGPPPRADLPGARWILHRRRSAVAMDGRSSLPRTTFLHVLQRVAAGGDVPFATLPWPPAIDLVLFVHRVEGLPPGLYLLARNEQALPALRAATRPELHWQPVEDAPAGLSLFCLLAGDARGAARTIMCHQEIAADGAFAVAMLAEFEPRLRAHGAWFYRALHWEAGAVGQVLYLEAEAAGLRATGIGCFFDDELHGLLGLGDQRFQMLYGFTIGGAVDDPRLRTAPPYAHLLEDRKP